MPISQFCGGDSSGAVVRQAVQDHILVHDVIRSYQTRGFLAANLDPLGIVTHNKTLTKCGLQLNANENVFIKDDFFKGMYVCVYICVHWQKKQVRKVTVE